MIHIYMNERIRKPKPDGPVIKVDNGPASFEGNEILIKHWGRVIGRVVFDPPNNPSKTHEVKAWVELDSVAVTVERAR